MRVMRTTRSLVKMRSSSLMMNRKLRISAWEKKGFFPFPSHAARPSAHRLVIVRRSGSRTSSRATTPGVTGRRDYDHFSGNNPYDEHGAYDMNYGADPSRPLPMPYDDPYSDSFASISAGGDGGSSTTSNNTRNGTGRQGPAHMDLGASNTSVHASDRNLGPRLRHHNPRGRGRGGTRNRQSDRGRRGRGRGAPQHSQSHHIFPQQSGSHDYSGVIPPSGSIHPYSHQRDYGGGGEWNYGASASVITPQAPVFGLGPQNTFPGVQPHINPRFANQLGFNFSQMPQIPQISPGVESPSSSEQYDPRDGHLQTAAHHHQWDGGSG